MTHTHAAHRLNVLLRLYWGANYDNLRRKCEVGGSEGRRLIADVWALTDYRHDVAPLTADLETIFGHLERISDLESGSYGVWVDGADGSKRDIQPHDHDYTAARDQAVQEEDDDMNGAIEALLLGGES